MNKKLTWLIVLVLVPTILAGCSSPNFASKERTNYVVADFVGGQARESYLTADHPDVQTIQAITKQFLQTDMTQDYRSLNWKPLDAVAEVAVRELRVRNQLEYTAEGIAHQYKSSSVTRITFYLDQGALANATVTGDVNVVYTSASAVYLGTHNLKLDEESKLPAEVSLRKINGTWRVLSASYGIPSSK